jgi:hypothetical protein
MIAPGLKTTHLAVASFVAASLLVTTAIAAEVKMDKGSKIVEHTSNVFKPDPDYKETPYSADAQRAIYGGKSAVETPRPLLELGRKQYDSGPFEKGIDLVGKKNLLFQSLSIYGDWRTAVAYNDNGAAEVGRVATRLNLDIDWKLTSTERLHAFIRPLDQGGNFTRFDFAADDEDQGEFVADGNLQTLFFEGDLGSIATGLGDSYSGFDLPFSVGLMPLLFQNGVWMDDAFTGAAFSIPARNSVALDISNMDFTFFAGLDKVTSPAITDGIGDQADHNVNIYGAAAFVEANRGYWEAGYARLDGRDGLDEFDFHNVTLAHSRRFGALFSNSARVIWSFGQNRDNNVQQTADGAIILLENSLITSKPSTYIPYFNLFAGFDRPQSAARDNGGILKNVGINFETDALTGYPKLDDTGHDTFGGAIGINYLFGLDRQIVAEVAGLKIRGNENDSGRAAAGDQFAVGLRYQQPISKTWIIRGDAMAGFRDAADDLMGVRFEVRRKF